MLKGIDIYHRDGEINWGEVKQKPDFVIMKIGKALPSGIRALTNTTPAVKQPESPSVHISTPTP